ncbi:hypothetical protein QYF36_005372 [Acer negundo]|nr:hypothetical protein QYF36_005372 [Acer negundo]
MAEIFSKLLTRVDIESPKLVVPTRALRHFMGILEGGHFMNLQVMDWVEQMWNFKLYTRPNGPYRKPVLTKGWAQFVRAKDLREGDELIFSVNGDGYRIVVLRRPHRFNIIMDVNELEPFIVPDYPAAPIHELDLFV